MTTLYRSGGLLSVEELSNDNAVWFDSVSTESLQSKYLPHHFGRCSTVFTSLFAEDAFMWAERRVHNGEDATIYEIEVDDSVPLLAYRYGHYDNAMWKYRDGEEFQWYVNAYWNSGTDVNHWLKMWSRLMEGYENSQLWEVKLPVDVAASAVWSVHRPDDVLRGMYAPDWDTSLPRYNRSGILLPS